MEQKSLDRLRGAELAQTLSYALCEASEICGVYEQIQHLEYDKKCLINHRNDYLRLWVIWFIFFMIVQHIMVYTNVSNVIQWVVDIIAIFGAGFLIRKYGERKSQERATRVRAIDISIESLNTRLAYAFKENSNMYFAIPEDFRYPKALSTMLGYVNNMRENTWRGCANRYEIEKRYDKSEEMQKQILQSALVTQEYARGIEWNTFFTSTKI